MKREAAVFLMTGAILLVVLNLYPSGSALLLKIRTHSYAYAYSLPHDIRAADTSEMPSADAVPILLYHGVLERGEIGPNTSRRNFIAQMEMLKRNGYETISIEEYDLFRQGKFALPPKPIIITFDDGRKDSYYTTDPVFEKLGFKASMFVATIKANTNDPFYLSWDELKEVHATLRWEIEAHGRNAHESVVIDPYGTTGKYLTSRLYSEEGGLETVSDFEKRVEEDYVNGISDIKQHLGLEAVYFAVPLNDYGGDDPTNFEESHGYNLELTKRYFKFAFIQAESDAHRAFETFYNYRDSDPHSLRRLEVKDMSADDLQRTLEHFTPRPASLVLPTSGDVSEFLLDTELLYGDLEVSVGADEQHNEVTLYSKGAPHDSGRVVFGDWGWRDYKVKAEVIPHGGTSASLIAYYADEENYITLDWSEGSARLLEYVNGVERELAWSRVPTGKSSARMTIVADGGFVGAYIDEITVAMGEYTKLESGSAGFSVWNPKERARSTIRSLEIQSLDDDR